MSLYRIVNNQKLVELQLTSISEEKLYPLLKNNPRALLPGEDERIVILGYKIPCGNLEIDLLGINNNGNLVIVEAKGYGTPREVVAQILEYASCVESWGMRELKDKLVNKKQLSPNEDLISWIRKQFKEHYGEEVEVDIKEDNINVNQRLILFLPSRDPHIERMVEYLRKRGLDIYYVVYNIFREKETQYLVSYVVVGSNIEPIKKLQAQGTISMEEFIEKLKKKKLNNIAEIAEHLYKQGKAYTRKHLIISLLNGEVRIEIADPETYPQAWIYIYDENVLDRVINIAKQLNLPLIEEKIKQFKPRTAPIILQGIEGLQHLDKTIKQLVKMIEEPEN